MSNFEYDPDSWMREYRGDWYDNAQPPEYEDEDEGEGDEGESRKIRMLVPDGLSEEEKQRWHEWFGVDEDGYVTQPVDDETIEFEVFREAESSMRMITYCILGMLLMSMLLCILELAGVL